MNKRRLEILMGKSLSDQKPAAPHPAFSASLCSALSACPFCGGEARFSSTYDEMSGWGDKEWGNVYCTHCGIRTPDEKWNSRGMQKDNAIKLWNERDTGRCLKEKQQRLNEDAARASLNSAAL